MANKIRGSKRRKNIARSFRPYTDEELRMIEEADRYPADLREQVKAFYYPRD